MNHVLVRLEVKRRNLEEKIPILFPEELFFLIIKPECDVRSTQ